MLSKIVVLFSLFFICCNGDNNTNTTIDNDSDTATTISASKADEIILEYMPSQMEQEVVEENDNIQAYIEENFTVWRSTTPFSTGDTIHLRFIFSGDSTVVLETDSWVYYTKFPTLNCLSTAITLIDSHTGEITLFGTYGCSDITYLDELDNFEDIFK